MKPAEDYYKQAIELGHVGAKAHSQTNSSIKALSEIKARLSERIWFRTIINKPYWRGMNKTWAKFLWMAIFFRVKLLLMKPKPRTIIN